jgi:hypothetical protein
MRKLRMLTALAVIGVSACAERMVKPAVVPAPPAPKAAPKPRPTNVELRRQAEKIADGTRNLSVIRPRQVSPTASIRPEQPRESEAKPPKASAQTLETQTSSDPPRATVLPPPFEPDESNFPFAALMPPPPEPAEPTFPSVAPTVELPPPPQPAAPGLPGMPIEAAMPPPSEPAQPSFPVVELLPPPSEPAEPSLPSQEEIIAESSNSIPFPYGTSFAVSAC